MLGKGSEQKHHFKRASKSIRYLIKIKVTLSSTRGYGDRASVLASDVRLANYSTSGAYGTPLSLMDAESISTSKNAFLQFLVDLARWVLLITRMHYRRMFGLCIKYPLASLL